MAGRGTRYSVERRGSDWYVIEQTSRGSSVGGPFETRAYAREVLTGARMMRDRRAARAKTAAPSSLGPSTEDS